MRQRVEARARRPRPRLAAIAYFALVYAPGHLPATITSVGLLAQVPSTALLAMLLLGEPLTAVQMLSGAKTTKILCDLCFLVIFMNAPWPLGGLL